MGIIGSWIGAIVVFLLLSEFVKSAVHKIFVKKRLVFVITTIAFVVLYVEAVLVTLFVDPRTQVAQFVTNEQYEDAVMYAKQFSDPIAFASDELPAEEKFCGGRLTRESSYHPDLIVTLSPEEEQKLFARYDEYNRIGIYNRLKWYIRLINGFAWSIQVLGIWFVAIAVLGNWKLLLITLTVDIVWYLIVFGPQIKAQIMTKLHHNQEINAAQKEWESNNKEASFFEKQSAISNETKNSSDKVATKGGIGKIIEEQREGALKDRYEHFKDLEDIIKQEERFGYLDINCENTNSAAYKRVFSAIKTLEKAEQEGIYKKSSEIRGAINMIRYFKDLPPANASKRQESDTGETVSPKTGSNPIVYKSSSISSERPATVKPTQSNQMNKQAVPKPMTQEPVRTPASAKEADAQNPALQNDASTINLKSLSVLELIALRNESAGNRELVARINEEIGSRAKA